MHVIVHDVIKAARDEGCYTVFTLGKRNVLVRFGAVRYSY